MPEPLSSDVRDLLALRLLDGLGPTRIAALLEHFGSAARALRASQAELLAVPGIGPQLSSSLAPALKKVDVSEEVERIHAAGVDVLVLGQPNYPASLAALAGAPYLLFVRGSILPEDGRAVALVGTRNPTPAGRKMAKTLAEGLARAGVVVVSGLARGIDGIAHQGALDGGGRTLAVLAGGLSRVYPPEHRTLAQRVVASGALITESPMLQDPVAGLFPARNRIISGLARVVVIVQAAAKSGALITAEHAADQGRTVMAVPGAVDEEASGGCHALIRDGAVLCRGVDDVLEELDGVSVMAQREKARRQTAAAAPVAPVPPGLPLGLDETQKRVWEFLGSGAKSVDQMAQQLGLGVPQLSGVLMMLEMKKVVTRLPGNRYERC